MIFPTDVIIVKCLTDIHNVHRTFLRLLQRFGLTRHGLLNNNEQSIETIADYCFCDLNNATTPFASSYNHHHFPIKLQTSWTRCDFLFTSASQLTSSIVAIVIDKQITFLSLKKVCTHRWPQRNSGCLKNFDYTNWLYMCVVVKCWLRVFLCNRLPAVH